MQATDAHGAAATAHTVDDAALPLPGGALKAEKHDLGRFGLFEDMPLHLRGRHIVAHQHHQRGIEGGQLIQHHP